MNALVFGGTRHLGAHVVAELRKRGHDVSVIDFGDAEEYAEKPLLSSTIPLQLIAEETPDAARDVPLEFDAAEFDCVFLCAADAYAEATDPAVPEQVPAAQMVIVERLLAAGAKTVVLTSSAEVYDVTATTTLDERTALGPRTREGHNCVDLETAVGQEVASGTPAAILRCAIVCGSGAGVQGARRHLKIAYLLPGVSITRAKYPDVSVTFGAGSDRVPRVHVRDFVHVSDVATAHVAVAEALVAGASAAQGIFNVGTGSVLPVAEVLEIVAEAGLLCIEGTPNRPPTECNVALTGGALESAVGWAPLRTPASVVTSEVLALREAALAPTDVGGEIRCGHEHLYATMSRRWLTLYGLLVVRDKIGVFRNEDVQFEIKSERYRADILTTRGVRVPFKHVRVSPYRLRIPRSDTLELGLQNPVRVVWVGKGGEWLRRRLRYSLVRTTPKHRRSRLFKLTESDSVLYVRQEGSNLLYLTMRARNATDGFWMRALVRVAYLASRVVRKRAVLLYEKESARYEESAAVLFEEMVRRGRRDAFFVLKPEMLHKVPEDCRSQVLPRFSFRHFYYFFCASTFIGTETVFSAAELRSSDKLLMGRISQHRYRFVFLQHGVMYMVALSSRQRGFFRAGGVFPPGTKIVCSSKREARHFSDLGEFPESDLYVTGLPKFDRARREPDADLILIMPTWRPWEQNLLRTDSENVPYVRMLLEMYEAVPDHLKPKTFIMPHPLVQQVLLESDLADRMWTGDSYDEALSKGALLITDYSSIAYDAFYRGMNVIFWWKEKDFCMQQYQGHLMIDEDTAPGPVCSDADTLRGMVEKSYMTPQDGEYVRRYREIVEFHDNRNTERLLGLLERDGLI